MKYDYIITGTGAAGLSLAYYLSQSSLKEKRVLLIDRAKKNKNDRTWCFWENGDNPFETIVHHTWEELYFKSPTLDKLMDISPYRYKMIQGLDFYNHILNILKQHPNFEIIQDEVKSIDNQIDKAIVHTKNNTFEAHFVFNSIVFEYVDFSKSNSLAQHFGGWIIETEAPVFDPSKATLMDFRIPQCDETRFMYLLPTSQNTALIEATAFSNNILSAAQYDDMIVDYIQEFTEIGAYKILHKEIGVIPMTNYNFKKNNQSNVIHIGTMGGNVKSSTGYAFMSIQNFTKKIVTALEKEESPHLKQHWFDKRFVIYDSILLNVMLKKRVPIQQVFSLLFKRNKAGNVLKFLGEQTSFLRELSVIIAAPKIPFLQAAFDEMWQLIRRKKA